MKEDDAIRDSDALHRLSQALRTRGLRGDTNVQGAVDAALAAIDSLRTEKDRWKAKWWVLQQTREMDAELTGRASRFYYDEKRRVRMAPVTYAGYLVDNLMRYVEMLEKEVYGG